MYEILKSAYALVNREFPRVMFREGRSYLFSCVNLSISNGKGFTQVLNSIKVSVLIGKTSLCTLPFKEKFVAEVSPGPVLPSKILENMISGSQALESDEP